MESEIDNFGAYLEDCLKANKEIEAEKLIKYVRAYLDENVGTSILNYTISKVFDDDFNLLKFLNKIADLKWKLLSSGYDLLYHFLQNFKENMRPYVSEISKTCVRISISKASAFDKTKYADLLCDILKEGYDLPPNEVADIYNQFYKFCGVHQKDTSAHLQKNIFKLLGIIGKNYSGIISNYENLLDKYVRELTSQSRLDEKKREKYVISGCIEGLKNLLDSFSIENVQTKSNIYGVAKKLLMLSSEKKTFDVRDIVSFVSKHCNILSIHLYEDDPQLWHKKIIEFTTSANSDNRKAGQLALETFYGEMARILHTRTEERDRRIFEYFYEYFLKTMQNSFLDLIEIRLAIKGFGIFSAPSEVHMKKEKLTEMFIIIIVRLENDYFTSDALSAEQLEYLPDYIHCFSTILHQIGEYSPDQIESLQKISVLMIKSFPKLNSLFHYSVYDSLILTMCYLHQYNSKSLRDYLQHVIYQGVLWSCSHRTTFDVDLDVEADDGHNTTTYKSYVSLWKSLLSFSTSKNPKYASISIAIREVVVQAVYDELIITLLQLINKLNYKTKFLDEDVPSIDPSTSEAEKLDDYIIFINVVELYSTLLPTNYVCFKKWIKMYSTQIISQSLKYPFVSGFYKLLRIALQISDQLNYFAEAKLDLEERKKCFQSLQSFLQKVVLNVQEYKDDLQISCLQLLLAIPITFVPQLLHSMDSIFSMALSVGRGYLQLAEYSVDTLDKWYQILPEEDLKPVLKSVLPHFDAFLRSKGFTGDPDVKLSLLQGKKPKRSKRKVIIENDGELVNLQHKILMFLGQLNSELCNFMVESNMEVVEVPWETEPQLKFTLPYKEVKPNIYLDRLVPRVLELAMYSGDQKTRITACELLHSIIIFMLGTSRKMNVTKQKELLKLFEKVMLPLVQLGCDSNEVVRQLFNPLVFQIVHWYSNPLQFLSSETSILVEILMDGLSHPSNTSVRDLSGKCIKDFVKWTIKQLKEGELEKFTANIETVVTKISLYLVHPNSFKRLGATLAFNNIYTELREEESMLDMYWFQLFHSIMFSLSLQSSKANNNQIEQALKHIERVLRQKMILFNTYSDRRVVPSGIEGPLMKDVVFWVLQQTGSTNLNYRRTSVKLFCSLAAYVEDSATAKDFVLKFVESEDSNWFIKLYEENGIKETTTLNDISSIDMSVTIIIKWFKDVIRCLDAYKYLLDYKIVTYDKILESSKIHQALNFYIQHVSDKTLENVMESFAEQIYIEPNFLAEEIEEYNQVKNILNLAIFDFFTTVLDKTKSWSVEIDTNSFWSYVSSNIFLSNVFAASDEESGKKLETLLIKLFEKLPADVKNDFKAHLTNYFTSNCVFLPLKSSNNIPLLQRHLLKGWILLNTCGFKIKLPKAFDTTLNCVFDGLVDHKEIEYGRKLSPTVEEYSKLLLKIHFSDAANLVSFCACLIQTTLIKDPDNFVLIKTGDYFMKCYEDIVLKYTLENLENVIKTIFKNNELSKLTRETEILKNILSSFSNNTALKNKFKHLNITEIVLRNWGRVFEVSPGAQLSVRNQQIDLLLHIIKIDQNKNTNLGKNIKYFNTWFIDNLNYYPEMPDKNLLQFKIKLLEFLYCAVGPEEDDDNNNFRPAFEKLKNYNNELEKTDHVLLFKSLLNQFFKSKSRLIIEPVLYSFLKVQHENLNLNIDEKINSYLSSINSINQYKSIILIYKLISSDTFDTLGGYKIAKIFLFPMLRRCSYEAFERFFVENIKEVLKTLNTKNNEDMIILLSQKTVKFILLAVLFSRIKVSAFAEKNCAISKAAYGDRLKTGKEVLVETIRIIKSVRKEDVKIENPVAKDYYRLYQCEAFNTLISAISNTKTSPEDLDIYYHIFVENKDTGEYIWERIIDCNKNILIQQCFDEWPKMKKTFIHIRNENRTKLQSAPVKYIESQSLFNSTLSEDVSRFDFSNTLVRTPEMLEAVSTLQVVDNFIEMEGVDINDHECMAAVCGLVNYLIDSKISPLPSDFNQPLPKWLEALRIVLAAENTEKNVKIFLARMIHNMKFIFRYHGKHFFEPIVNFIVQGCTGESINYFVTDLLQMLLSWSHDLDLIDVRRPVNNLISYLIMHSHNERTDMLKSNLEIIKSCVEMWKHVIDVPHDQLLEILSSNNKKLLGVHLVGIILANGLIPWTNENIKKFNRTLVNHLKIEKQSTIFKPAAEVLGMILNKINLDENLKAERKILNDDLEGVLRLADPSKLYHSLEQIQIHFPQIIDKFLRTIVAKMFGEKKPSLICIGLKNVLRRIDSLEIPLIAPKDLINYLNTDDSDLKLLTLQVVNKMINSIKKDLLPNVLNAVVEHKTNSSPMIRNAVYDILITIYKDFSSDETEVGKQLIAICKPILLSGVIDSDIELQEKILKFWCIDRFQMLTLSERFEKSLLDLYSPETESYYLGYVNYYLLEGCRDTPEYDKLMFDHPLSECEFDEYQLLINWRAQHASMAPMFANTQQDFQLNMAVPQINGVRATASARAFTPTVSSIDLTSSLDTASSFIFSPISSSAGSVSSNLNSYSPQLTKLERPQHSHSKRFLSNASKIRLEFSKAATDKKQKTEQQRRERIRRKEGNVVMYRQYRKGELPDIQIPNSAIIQPLQMLARRDGYLARQLYVLLFKGLMAETKNSDNFVAAYNTGVESVLHQTHMFTPNVIGALLDIILQHNKNRGFKKMDINPDILFTACKNSGLLSVGCLLLEEYINLNDGDDEPSSSKRGCAVGDKTVDYWVKLADMYKELNEWDTVVGIFSSTHMDCSVEVSKAIAAEANSDWSEASKKYKSLLYTDTNYSRKDFYYESYYKCYSNLSDWSGISKSITDTFDDCLWDKDFNQEKILPWYILGEMCSLIDDASSNTILQNLTDWMKDREKAEYLKDKFSAELAVLALIRKDVNASKHYTQNCFSKFLEEWSNQNPLFSKIRAKTLMNFQKIIDINKYLTCREEDVLNQISYFERNSDLSSNSVIESEIRTLCRYLVLRSFEEKLRDLDMEEHSPSLQDLKLTSDLSLIAFSLEKNNCFVAKKYCRKNGRYLNDDENPLAKFKLINSMSKIGIMNADLAENKDKISTLIYTWQLLESDSTKCPETYVDLKIESLQILSQISQSIYDVLKISPDLAQANRTKIQALYSVEGSYPNNLLNYSEDHLKAAIKLGEKYSPQSQNKKLLNGLTKAYLSLITFAQQQDETYAEEIVRCVLRAMKIGSKNARQLFPYLLELENLETSLLKTFKEESLPVPTWMFILWIPQFLASLNTSKYLAFEDIVIRLAVSYPQALIYPYKIAKERHDLKSGDGYFLETIAKLDEWLKNELAEKILFELSCMCVPELYLKYHLIKILKNIDGSKIKDDLRELEENIAKKLESSRNFKSIEDSFKRFQKKNTGRINLETMTQNLKNYITENNSRIRALKKKYNFLEQCSPWLSTFQATKWTDELEIPGQYSGDKKPLIKYHSKISSFSNKISMWSSLRKPIKIVMYGNDAKEYPFIVKFGEDIRQDQRIQQLFSLSNSILLSDSSCQQRNLFLEQYQVIPLTTSLGLIQMLENNLGLGTFMFKTVDKKTEEQYSLKICDKYVKWIKGDQVESFWKACQTRSRDETNQAFTGFVSEVPANILRESFWSISLDTEAYAFRRNQFIVSYSTMCLVHWLFGIGDRNLDNCLVLQKTGRAVGIDFGYAFGTATQHLPIPELIPFRLTPHILSLMEPLRDIGFVEQTMVHCLRALRKQKHTLLSTMSVFVRDPSVDWLEFAKKEEYGKVSSDWYPTQKIAIAKRKLDGANPANIIIDELKTNVALSDKKVLKAYSEIAKGDGHNIRCTLPEDGLSEEDQVKALLDQATDYNILGRMFYGLRLWI